MSLKKIYEQLGLSASYEEEATRFNERLRIILDEYYIRLKETAYYEPLIKKFAFLAGISDYYGVTLGRYYFYPLTTFFDKGGGERLPRNLAKLSMLLSASSTGFSDEFANLYFQPFVGRVQELFETSVVDIGYFLNGETILKAGAKELDEKLILDSLSWLSDYREARELFENSLRHYLSKAYRDAITNAYSSLESLVKTFLRSQKRLDSQEAKTELLKKLKLEGEWGKLLFNFSQIAHEFSSRHGKAEGKQSSKIAPDLVEFYLYMTGTFIRLIVQRIRQAS